jgi:hypothetical protein
MIEEVRFVKLGAGTLILQVYDGRRWYTPRVIDLQDLSDGAKGEVFRALELP